jgi:hypothetical protein
VELADLGDGGGLAEPGLAGEDEAQLAGGLELVDAQAALKSSVMTMPEEVMYRRLARS